MLLFQSTVRTVQVVQTNTAVHPFTTELTRNSRRFYISTLLQAYKSRKKVYFVVVRSKAREFLVVKKLLGEMVDETGKKRGIRSV